MNNGVNPNQNQQNNTNSSTQPVTTPETNTLANMEGVKLAPIDSAPIDASKNAQKPAPAPQPTQVVQQPSQPVLTQTTEVTTEQPTEAVPTPETVVEQKKEEVPVKKKKSSIVPLLLLIIVAMGGYIYYNYKDSQTKKEILLYNYTPKSSIENEIELDLNSTLVKDLYKRVQTNIREDMAQPEFNYNLKMYLAYRQILESDKYETNCNMFNPTIMEPYKCEINSSFTPKAFNAQLLETEFRKLFGETTNFQHQNIQLGNSCVGGYQYIEARGEYVQGFCDRAPAIFFKVNKELVKATSYRNTIVLEEKVQYIEAEKMNLPSYLKNGVYKYVFRLDINYNYILLNKTYIEQY